jgi:hypothetical protein
MTQPDSNDNIDTALDHAWAWHSLHTSQRAQGLNYFLLAVAFLAGAYVSTLQNRHTAIAAGIAVGGVALTAVFWALEQRRRNLIGISQAALIELESRLASTMSLDELNMTAHAADSARWFSSYTRIIGCLSLASGTLFVIALVNVIR